MGNRLLRILWSRDRWRHVTQNGDNNVVKSVTLLINNGFKCQKKNVNYCKICMDRGQKYTPLNRIERKRLSTATRPNDLIPDACRILSDSVVSCGIAVKLCR